jgi:hypothetical protein
LKSSSFISKNSKYTNGFFDKKKLSVVELSLANKNVTNIISKSLSQVTTSSIDQSHKPNQVSQRILKNVGQKRMSLGASTIGGIVSSYSSSTLYNLKLASQGSKKVSQRN